MSRWLQIATGVLPVVGIAIIGRMPYERYLTFLASEPAIGSPVALVENLNYDFGRLAPGAQANGFVIIRNIGNRRLLVQEDGCSCAQENTSIVIVPPGASARVEFSFTAPANPGSVRQKRRYLTNDPELANLLVTLRAHVDN